MFFARRIDEMRADDAGREKKPLERSGEGEFIPVGSEVELTRQPDWNGKAHQLLLAEFQSEGARFGQTPRASGLLFAGGTYFRKTKNTCLTHSERHSAI